MNEDQALGRLHEILIRPEYQVERSVPWWEQVIGFAVDQIWALFSRVFQAIGDTASGREGLTGWLVLGACAALLIVVGVYLFRTVRISVLRESRLGVASLAERRQQSDQLWRAAHQLAAAGRLGEAVRLVYLSALYALDEKALLHVESGLTNREHALRLSQLHPALGASFGAVVEHYDRVRYGSVAVGPDSFAELSENVDRVRAAAFARASA